MNLLFINFTSHEDQICPYTASERMHALIPDSTLIILPSTGHYAPLEQGPLIVSHIESQPKTQIKKLKKRGVCSIVETINWRSLMYKIIIPLIAASSMATCLPAEEKKEESKPDVAKLSEALGHMIGKNLLDMGVNLDIAQVIKGLKDSNHGKASPLSETECAAAITCAQEQSFNEKATKNLALAEAFLEKQKDKEGIISIEEGKIQYRIESKGTGPAVEPHSIPTVKYSGKFLDGKEFGSSKEAEPLALDELIPGMKLGMIGMKEGEKRTVYIHPSLGYGTAGMLPPNSLLCFEVEVVKVVPQNNASLPEMTAEVEECDEGDLL